MIKFMLIIVYLSLAELNLYRCCINFTIQLALLRVFNVKGKNFAFYTSKVITNAWFSMKNYSHFLPQGCLVARYSVITLNIIINNIYVMLTHF